MKKFILICTSAAVIAISLSACGKADTVNASKEAMVAPALETPEPTPALETPEPTPALETPEPTPALETPEPTPDWSYFINENIFDLTGYAEKLGYTWLPDPEWDGLSMYAINNGGRKYFFCCQNGNVSLYWEDDQGRLCGIGGGLARLGGDLNFIIRSKGQDDAQASEIDLMQIASIMEYFATANPVDVFHIPLPDESITYDVITCEGKATYFPNGLIRQREHGNIIEDYAVQPWNGYNVLKTK